MSLGTLTVDLVMKTGKFETDTKRAEKRAKEMAKNIDATVSKVGTALASAAAIGFGAFAVGVKSAIDAADQMGEAAEKIGVTTEALSELSFAAKLSAVEQETLQKALAKLSVDLTKQDSILKSLGITATTADGALMQLATLFQEMPNGLEETAAAAKIFGERIGPDLVPLLNRGASGIQQLRERARELGVTISSETAKAAGDFNDSMDEIKFAMDGAFRKVAEQLLPKMEEFSKYIASPEFAANINTGVTAILKIVNAIGLVVEKTEYFGKRLAEITSQSTAGAEGDIPYIKSRMADLKAANDQAIELDFGRFEREYAEYERMLADAEALERRTKADASKRQNGVRGGAPMGGRNLPPAKGGLSNLFDPKDEAAKRDAAARRAASEAAARDAEAKRQAEEAARDLASANELLNGILNTQAAEIGGPLVQAAQNYTETMLDIVQAESELVRLGKLDEEAQVKLNLAREQALSLYEQEVKAIQDKKTPAEEELQRLRDELELIGLTNEERAKRIFLMNNPDATQEQVDEAGKLVGAIDQASRAQQAMDQFRSSATDAFASFLDGSMSAKDAFEAFADSVVQQIARILAEQAIAALFGGQGTTGGGSFGGVIGSFFGSIFGGGRASGGAVLPGRSYRVNENGPEILTYQGKDYLMTGSGGGMVKPTAGGANITVNVAPTTDRRTAQQIAQRIAEKQNTAVARNR